MTGRTRVWLFAFFGLAMAVSISAAEAALALLLIDAGLSWKRRTAVVRSSPVEIPVLIFFAWGVVVTALAGSAPLMKSVSTQSGLVLVLLAVRVWSLEDNERWMRWFLYGAAATALFAVVQVAIGVDRYPLQDQLIVPPWLEGTPEKILRAVSLRNERAVGTRSHPLTFAEGLLVAFLLLVAFPLDGSKRWKRFKWAGLPLLAAGLLFSQGRGVWLGLIAASLTLGFYWRHRRDVRWLMAVAALSALLVVGVVPKMRARALSIFDASGGQAADQKSRGVRFQLWSQAKATILAHPITGVGLKGVKLVVDDPLLKTPRTWSETHNIFLQVTAERGFVGLAVFLWILALAFRQFSRAPAGWREGGVALLIGLIVAGLTESWIHDKEIALIFWAALGAIEKRRLMEPGA